MMDKEKALSHLRAALGHRPLSRWWAKAEILLGLLATGTGLLVGDRAVSRVTEMDWPTVAGGLALFVLGGYLALAGHRSHLYQSSNELAAYVAEVGWSREGESTK